MMTPIPKDTPSIVDVKSLLEQVIIDAFISVLNQLTQEQGQRPMAVCYRYSCPNRDEIP
jgi:hypothetical protein